MYIGAKKSYIIFNILKSVESILGESGQNHVYTYQKKAIYVVP